MEVTIDDDSGTLRDLAMSGYSSNVNTNFGGASWINCQRTTASDRTNTLLYVDLSAILNVTVISAKFGLDFYSTSGVNAFDYYKVHVDWVEGTSGGAYQAGSSCWNYRISDTDDWDSAGCEGSGTDHAIIKDGSITVSGPSSDFPMPLTNVLVQDWIDTPASNRGIVWIKPTIEAGKWSVARSSEATTGNKPYFYMEYIIPPGTSKDISRKDKKILSVSDDITYVAPEAADADTRYEVASEKVEEDSNINHYLSQYKKIVDTSDQVAEILDERCKDFTFKFEPKKMPALAQAIRKVFGKDTSEITYDMYKQVLDEQIALSEKIGDEIFAQ